MSIFLTRWVQFYFDDILCSRNSITSIYSGNIIQWWPKYKSYDNWREYYFFQNTLDVSNAVCFGTSSRNFVLFVFKKLLVSWRAIFDVECFFQLWYDLLNILSALSRWCISYRKKAKQIVETWDKLFRSAQREQRVSFLYLANDILQNSRRKGSEFVNEFWKVLPTSVKHVYESGDENGKKAASRLVIPFLLSGRCICLLLS